MSKKKKKRISGLRRTPVNYLKKLDVTTGLTAVKKFVSQDHPS